VGNGGCCLKAGITVPSTDWTAVAAGLAVGVTVGLAAELVGVTVGLAGRLVGVPWEIGVCVGVAACVDVRVAGIGTVLVPVALLARATARLSPGSVCPARATVP
jgi:hypothetical protein